MGYSGKPQLKQRSIELRKSGLSIRAIQQKLKVAKSSVSLWTRDILLTKDQLKILQENRKKAGLRGGLVAARKKIEKRITETTNIMNGAKNEIGSIKNRERFLIGIALYFAEGDKAGHNVAFTNTDSKALVFMVAWLRVYCEVKPERIRCSLYLHDNLNENKVKKYWSSLLHIPLSQFTKSYMVKNNPNRFRKSKHEFGVCRVTVSDVRLLRRILGWISGVFTV